MNNKLTLFTIGIYLFIALVIYGLMSMMHKEPILASVYPRIITVNDSIHFSDSTKNVETLLWEFGNGQKSTKLKGTYKFQLPGTYIVKVTVNENEKDTFYVTVKKPEIVYKKDSTIFIYADKSAIVNEKVHFKAIGTDIQWCEWYFDGANKIESHTQETFYAFEKPGDHQVKLITNINPVKPVAFSIRISPEYQVTEPVIIKPQPKPGGGGGGGGDEFKERLQKLANGENFNTHFNVMVSKFLCNNSKTPVLVNGKSNSDFYSYCQSLQINSGTHIDQATLEINPKNKCASKIIIVQH